MDSLSCSDSSPMTSIHDVYIRFQAQNRRYFSDQRPDPAQMSESSLVSDSSRLMADCHEERGERRERQRECGRLAWIRQDASNRRNEAGETDELKIDSSLRRAVHASVRLGSSETSTRSSELSPRISFRMYRLDFQWIMDRATMSIARETLMH